MTPSDRGMMPVLSHHLREERQAYPRLTEELGALLQEIALAGKVIARGVAQAGLTGRLGETGEVNVQGERVKKLDEWANEVMTDVLGESGLASVLISEEMEQPLRIAECRGPSRYVVCFDPVDGSSNTDINGIVGTIFGIRPGRPATDPDPATAALQPGTAQVAAGYIMYGPATILVYAAGHGVHGLTLDTSSGEFTLTHPSIRMPAQGKTYSVNEGNAQKWTPAARGFVDALKSGAKPYSLRYVGALVADFHRTILEGGIYLYPAEAGSARGAGKLRLLYEAAPLGLVVEAAGGKASTGPERILDLVPTEYHQRVPLLIGSATEVTRAEGFYRAGA